MYSSIEHEQTVVGIVTAIRSGIAEVVLCTAESHAVPLTCRLRGRLKKEWQMVTSLVVVGDRVTVRREADGTGVIEAVHPRRTKLSRPGFHNYEHIIAANIDQVVIVASVHQPAFKRNLIDRFLLLARQMDLPPLLVVNKCELEDGRVIDSWLEPFAAAGVPVIRTSTVTGGGLDQLRGALAGKISILAGQSGVGKSSLLNALFSEVNLKTQGTSWANKGRHTTTSSRLYPLPGGGYVGDTPGIKELALWETHEDDLEELFPEIATLAENCKFRDCTHNHEPRCAVRAALKQGEIEEGRYQNYLRLLQRK